MTSGTSISYKFYIFVVVLLATALFLFYDVYNSEMYECLTATYSSSNIALMNDHKPKVSRLFGIKTLDRDFQFHMEGNDVMVVLHIQKTGGSTFERHLVKLEHACKCIQGTKRCDCIRPGAIKKGKRDVWLFSRYSTGWSSCGVHADWTELTSCVPKYMAKKNVGDARKKRRYFYVTMVRNPINRYISEWKHVQRGATWNTSRHMCDGRSPTDKELPKCYKEEWLNVPLDEFMNCKYNLANNRQTRMLADLSLVGCYNLTKMPPEERNQAMLQSAKYNLRRLAFFGLTEHQLESQFVFEETFKLKFDVPFEQTNSTNAELASVTPQQYDRIKQLNSLDVKLYEFARSLFFQRIEWMDAKNRNVTRE
ncbi:heparan-sulfate 6-O-sulfotransferase 2-like [Amphiura filiformis]|uniref:heparan-sulfate 6-O-sulfotransferase 2-like n=1 Tax=Amphiura filiformis TaxID=82378 RepID=UPI003B20F20D